MLSRGGDELLLLDERDRSFRSRDSSNRGEGRSSGNRLSLGVLLSDLSCDRGESVGDDAAGGDREGGSPHRRRSERESLKSRGSVLESRESLGRCVERREERENKIRGVQSGTTFGRSGRFWNSRRWPSADVKRRLRLAAESSAFSLAQERGREAQRLRDRIRSRSVQCRHRVVRRSLLSTT